MSTSTSTSTSTNPVAQLRLLQLLSPVLPVGSFSYSQGLESAVHARWITNDREFRQWLVEWIDGGLALQEFPVLIRLYRSAKSGNLNDFNRYSRLIRATRDTLELRDEESAKANAYVRVLKALCPEDQLLPLDALMLTPLASIAWAAADWEIALDSVLIAYGHNWLENSVTNGIKLIPLGQSVGQQVLHDLSPLLVQAIKQSHSVMDDDIGFSMPAVSMASCAHETQYSRLFRS